MANETKPGNGALFKNDRKTSDKHPDYRGEAVLLDGTPVWLSAWLKTSQGGTRYMSVAFQPKDVQQKQAAPAAKQSNPDRPFDDEIPF